VGTEPQLLVLDASALVELVIAGEHRAAADRLLDRYARERELTLLTAAHGPIEATSALRRLVQRDLLDPGHAELALLALAEFDLVLDATAPRLRRIWSLRDRMSAYDAAYAATAEAYSAPLLTTDQRLLSACTAARIPAEHLSDPR
jgi:predicted nucleic acid-binding protein